MWQMISQFHKEGLTVILTTHYLEEAELMCNHIAFIHKGKVHVNTDMKSFLKSADKQTYIFDLKTPCKKPIALETGSSRLVDEHTLEVEVAKGVVLNDIFAELTERYHLQVLDVKLNAAKLEKLFIDIAKNK
jgi:ABC-2 type transport system ATP-binding protein